MEQEIYSEINKMITQPLGGKDKWQQVATTFRNITNIKLQPGPILRHQQWMADEVRR